MTWSSRRAALWLRRRRRPLQQEARSCNAPADICHGPCAEIAGHVGSWHRDEDGTEWKP